ncbi:MAG: class I SAM-dependent methyltransferase [Desulfobacteraceae bacterium]|nr:class I SAM-dependent methyltransferase [Desulfobacteraceae bacterium]
MFSITEKVKGFLDPHEGQRLYELARQAAPLGPCLEIGSYCGKSAVYLGQGCLEHGRILFSVDHHRGSEEQQPGEEYFDPAVFNPRSYEVDTLPFFRDTLKKANLEDTVVPIVCRSLIAAQAWKTPLALVFIDGGHAYETVLADYNAWAGHILPGGFLIIHDIFMDPCQGGQAPCQIYQKALASGLFKKLPMTKTLGVLRRLAEKNIPD